MSTNLTLTGAIDGLLMRGSPVWWRDEETPFVIVLPLAWPSPGPVEGVTLAAPAQELCLGVQDDRSNFTLDIAHPLGMATALHYLRERGHDLAWAARWPDVVAWSVISVSRGGGLLRGVIVGIAYMDGVGSALLEGGGTVGGTVRRGDGWHARHPGGARSGPYDNMNAAEDAFEAAALSAGYAVLITEDTLTLPPLPEVK